MQQKGNNSSSFMMFMHLNYVITVRRCFQVDICCRLVKRDDILEINLIYFSPHHKNKFVNSVNSLNNSLATLAETKKANMLDFTRSDLPNVSQSKSKFTTFMSSDNCSLFTDYTNLHISLNIMLQLIVS